MTPLEDLSLAMPRAPPGLVWVWDGESYLEFRRQSRAGMKRVLGAHTRGRYERTKLFRIYEHNVIPGLFQTSALEEQALRTWFGTAGHLAAEGQKRPPPPRRPRLDEPPKLPGEKPPPPRRCPR